METANKDSAIQKEYYIAYFDLLGYKDYFIKHPDNVMSFFDSIKNAIKEAKKIINKSGKQIKYKIFSDNILLYMEAPKTEKITLTNLLLFMNVVAKIQKQFVINFNLFLRGAITKGDMCIDDDFVFGKGLIEAVELEAKATYPRIIISQKIIKLFDEYHFLDKEQLIGVKSIEEKIKNNEKITDIEGKQFALYKAKLIVDIYIKYLKYYVVLEWDEERILNYIDDISYHYFELDDKSSISQLEELLDINYDKKKEKVSDEIKKDLKLHAEKILEKLKEHAKPNKTEKENEEREKILRKYLWAYSYHNFICLIYDFKDLRIFGNVEVDLITLSLKYNTKEDVLEKIQKRNKTNDTTRV